MATQAWAGYANQAEKQAAYRRRKAEKEIENAQARRVLTTLASILRRAKNLNVDGLPELDNLNGDFEISQAFVEVLAKRVMKSQDAKLSRDTPTKDGTFLPF